MIDTRPRRDFAPLPASCRLESRSCARMIVIRALYIVIGARDIVITGLVVVISAGNIVIR